MGSVGTVTIGVDIGQRVDPTAIAVVERGERITGRKYHPDGPVIAENPDERREWHHTVRFLERLPLGTSYPDVASRLADLASRVAERSGQRPRLYLDATGVGQPVVDELRRHKVQARIVPVYFNHGDRRMSGENDSIILGKAWLVSRMQALFQGTRLHLPPGHPEAETLVKELLDYEIRVDQNANDKYGAFKVGSHDDLVTALGLATQVDSDRLAEAFAKASGDRRALAGAMAPSRPARGDGRLTARQGHGTWARAQVTTRCGESVCRSVPLSAPRRWSIVLRSTGRTDLGRAAVRLRALVMWFSPDYTVGRVGRV